MSETTSQSKNDSASFRDLPNDAEGFGTIPKVAETFLNLRNAAERNENHTLTVREVARMFEQEGVARTERSIINWCQPNKSGVARLDCYFDPNDRKYFVTPQSVDLAIAEEKAKAARNTPSQESDASVLNAADDQDKPAGGSSAEDPGEIKVLKQEILDLKITNRGKDYFIEQLKTEHESFAAERQSYVEKLMVFNYKVGELETKLLQIEPPDRNSSTPKRDNEKLL